MSISRLPSELLHEVYSFLSLNEAHTGARSCKEHNQVIHTEGFARMQLERLFPAKAYTSSIAEYEKIVRIFANFVAGRYDYSNDEMIGRWPFPTLDCLSLGPFRLSIQRGAPLVIIKGQRGITNKIRIWNKPFPDNHPVRDSFLFSTSKTGVFYSEVRYAHYLARCSQGSVYIRLDFSVTQEEILFGLAGACSNKPDEDPSMQSKMPCYLTNALNPQAIYWELWFLNREKAGDRYPNYGRDAFEKPWNDHTLDRTYFVPNKERAEAILHYSMRLIARRYAAPHDDSLAETLFNRLQAALRNPVYGELYALRRPPQSEDVWNYGELAFHGRLGSATNADRRLAILNFVNKGQKVLG
jgi:hypothetical protein